jgi:thiamine-phosphate diphosphorylase
VTPLDPRRLRLVVITDEDIARPRTIIEAVALALDAGAPAIQLRDKRRSAGELLPVARELRRLTRQSGALFFINDRLDLALAVEADGVHLGPDDLPVAEVRRVVPDSFLIGYSTDDPDEGRRAAAEGADYLGVGAVWPTGSKADAGAAIGVDGVRTMVAAVPVPVVAIGGITVDRAPLLAGSGIAGIAVIGAVMAADDVSSAVRTLLNPTGR